MSIALSDKCSLGRIKFSPTKGTFNMAMGRKQLKILQSVITSIAINMMNSLPLFKESAKMFFYHKMVFPHITIPVCIRMFWSVNQNISSHPSFSPFPCWTIYSRWGSAAFTTAKKIGIAWGIIIGWAKCLATSFAIMNRNLAPPWRNVAIFLSTSSNQNATAMHRASYSLSISVMAKRTRLPAYHTIVHNSILPLVVINVKGGI